MLDNFMTYFIGILINQLFIALNSNTKRCLMRDLILRYNIYEDIGYNSMIMCMTASIVIYNNLEFALNHLATF